MNTLQLFTQKEITRLKEGKNIPHFKAGDALRIHVDIADIGDKSGEKRIQILDNVLCIKRKSRGIGSTFTVRKTSSGFGAERTFHLFSPRLIKIEVLRSGRVRRAKLYYMRNLKGKAARIKEEGRN